MYVPSDLKLQSEVGVTGDRMGETWDEGPPLRSMVSVLPPLKCIRAMALQRERERERERRKEGRYSKYSINKILSSDIITIFELNDFFVQ